MIKKIKMFNLKMLGTLHPNKTLNYINRKTKNLSDIKFAILNAILNLMNYFNFFIN